MKKVCVHLANGFEEIEALAVVDVLRRAEIETSMVSITKEKLVTGSHGITVVVDTLFEDVNYDEVAMIVLPGGMPGTINLDAHAGLKEMILQFSKENKRLAAICAAPLVYGKLGLLKGKNAVCYPGNEAYLEGAIIGVDEVVEHGNFITSKGPGTAIQFALKLVEILKDKETADAVKKAMLV